jgi:hypothetical protein
MLTRIKLSYHNIDGLTVTKNVPKTISSMAPRHGVAISMAAVGEIEKSDVYIVRQDLVEKMPPEAKRVNVKKR